MARHSVRQSFTRTGLVVSLLALALQLVGVPAVHAAGTPTPQWASAFAQDYAAGEGYAYVIAQNGQIVTSGASGFARSPHETQHPSTPWTINTRMNIASVSKTITATSIMLLVQQGKIALTDAFLPYIQSLITHPVGSGVSAVTIADLLQMKSGMIVDNPRSYAGTLTQYLNTYLQQGLIGTHGVTYAYSDANFDILQVVIDQVARTLTPAYTDYTDFASRAILAPMGVNTTLFSTTPDPQATATLSYTNAADTRAGNYWAFTANVLGSGGWIGPASELIKFAIGVRNNTVLSAATTSTMFTQQLGWYATNGAFGTYYQHNGGLTNGLNPGQGLNTGLIHFSNGYDAVVFANSPADNIIQQMIGAFEATSPAVSGLQFSPLSAPVRLLDTRGLAAFKNLPALTAGQTVNLSGHFAFSGIAVPNTAVALVGNATVDNSVGAPPGFATLFPSGQSRPNTSNLNFVPGTVRPNSFTVALGSDGTFNLYSSSGGNFIIDITGYYAPPATGGLFFHPLTAPIRLLDTRGQAAFKNVPTLTTGQTVNLPASLTVGGVTVPSGALALAGNATVDNSQNPVAPGFATLFPGKQSLPLASNLNFVQGTVAPNAFIVGVGSDGTFNLYSSSGGNFILDITGYFDANVSGGLLFSPLSAPLRELDTRGPAAYATVPALAAGATVALPGAFTFNGSTIPTNAKALVGNITVDNSTAPVPPGFATLYPSGVSLPTASNVNFIQGTVAPNAFIVGTGSDGPYNLYSSTGGNFIIDLVGYFA